MELVTGKLGVSAAPANDAGIKNWMAETLPKISVSDREPVEKIIDPSLLINEDLLLEVWAMAIVAKACLNPQSFKTAHDEICTFGSGKTFARGH